MPQELNPLIEIETPAGKMLINKDQLTDFTTRYPGLKITNENVAGEPEQNSQSPAADEAGTETEPTEPEEDPVA